MYFQNILVIPMWILVCISIFLAQSFFLLWNVYLLLLGLFLLLLLSQIRQRFNHSHRKQGKIKKLVNELNFALTSGEYMRLADEIDILDGGSDWRKEPNSMDCDWKLIKSTVNELRIARLNKSIPDLQTILFVLAPVLTRGFAGIDRASMYSVARGGTKLLIEDLTEEIINALDLLCFSNLIPYADKLAILDHARLRYGRTALVLSGGGTLAFSSIGVIRVLLESGIGLPKVIAGTSGGSIVAGLAACKNDSELLNDVTDSALASQDGSFFEPLPSQIYRFFSSWLRGLPARIMDADHLSRKLKAYYGAETTFLSAWQKTGRIVNITVSISGLSGRSTVLNYLSSPTVYLWSAVTASCALPGVMNPVPLYSRGFDGQPCKYESVHYVDGTLKADIPAKDLAFLFHVQRVIVSQTNPHLNLWIRQREYMMTSKSTLTPWPTTRLILDYLLCLLSTDISTRLNTLSKHSMIPKFFGEDFSELLSQEFVGDCTIIPLQGLLSQFRALSNPSEKEVTSLIHAGVRATLPKLSHIRQLLRVEQKLSESVARLRTHERVDGGSDLSARASPEDLTGFPSIASYVGGLSGLANLNTAHSCERKDEGVIDQESGDDVTSIHDSHDKGDDVTSIHDSNNSIRHDPVSLRLLSFANRGSGDGQVHIAYPFIGSPIPPIQIKTPQPATAFRIGSLSPSPV
jgi:predicted acylesterase/phospholipase RssA